MENDKKIVIKLRDLRKQNNLSQDELAESLGISRQSVIALEHGKYMPSLPLAVSLCNFFDSAFEDIFEFEREMDEICRKIHTNQAPVVVKSNLDEQKNNKPLIKREDKMFELEPFKPLRESLSLRDAIDRLFEDSVVTTQKLAPMPRIDIRDKKDRIIVKAELPGVLEDDVDIEITDNVMTISGEKKEEKESQPSDSEDDKGYYYKESYFGSFTRSFALPSEVVADKAEANIEGGVLTVTVPKVQPKEAKKIKVKTTKKQ